MTKFKAILVGAYLGGSLAILLACFPAWYAVQHAASEPWVKAHQSTYLWLAFAYFSLSIFIRILIRWQGLGTWIVVKVFTLFCVLLMVALAGLFTGPVGVGFALLGGLGLFECGCDRERRQREERIIVSRRPSLPQADLALSGGEIGLLRAAVIGAGLAVWILLGSWYMSDARTLGHGVIDGPAIPDPTPPIAQDSSSSENQQESLSRRLVHFVCVESTQNLYMLQCTKRV
jgi:hypothetical protein